MNDKQRSNGLAVKCLAGLLIGLLLAAITKAQYKTALLNLLKTLA